MDPSSLHSTTGTTLRGTSLEEAEFAVVLLHGRGGSAWDVMRLAPALGMGKTAFLAPEAAGNSWYPSSFMAPIAENEPWLSSALDVVRSTVERCVDGGLERDRIVLCGFSQGACLASEFAARNPARYAALIALTGGLVGPPGMDLRHPGSLQGTPVLLSSGDPDPHVPWARVEETAAELRRMGAEVELARYPGRPHTILPEELAAAREMLRRL